ncbi:MAG: hypothetical protein AAB668_03655 [Patescibacteria group bacterium]
MITKRVIAGSPKKVAFEFDNGDFQAIESTMAKYHFVDEQAMFRFALVILLRAERNGVYIDEGGNRIFVSPSGNIVSQDEQGNPSVA